MNNSRILFLFLVGVSALGILLALVVLVIALVRGRRADTQAFDDEDEYEQYDVYEDDYDSYDLPEQEGDIPPEPAGEDVQAAEEQLAQPDAQEVVIALPCAQPAIEEPSVTVAMPAAAPKTAGASQPKAADGRISVGGHTLRVVSAQNPGARSEQQDAIEISPLDPATVDNHGILCVLCDGMGGMRMGAEAASLAARSFVKSCLNSQLPLERAMDEAVLDANERVWALCRTDDLSGAGTTLVAAAVTRAGFSFVSVGDSHVYLLREGVLSQLNMDHNYLSELLQRVRKGELTREEALADPERAHLTSYLGMRKLKLIDRSSAPVDLQSGDRIVLASDGLFKVLSPKEIARRLEPFSERVAQELVEDVLLRKYRNQDNVSLVVIAVD